MALKALLAIGASPDPRDRWRRIASGLALVLGFVALVVVAARVRELDLTRELIARVTGRGLVRGESRGTIPVIFPVSPAQVHVLLPADIAAGDTVTAVVALHDGRRDGGDGTPSPAVAASMSGWSLHAGESSSTIDREWAVLRVPSAASHLDLELRDAEGRVKSRARVPVRPAAPPPTGASLPWLVPARGLFGIDGVFDGDARNTRVVLAGGERLTTWVESPRRVVVVGPRTVKGMAELEVSDSSWRSSALAHVITVTSQPVAQAVVKNETVAVVVTVSGLGHLSSPLPVIELTWWVNSRSGRGKAIHQLVEVRNSVLDVATLTIPVVAPASGELRTVARLRTGT